MSSPMIPTFGPNCGAEPAASQHALQKSTETSMLGHTLSSKNISHFFLCVGLQCSNRQYKLTHTRTHTSFTALCTINIVIINTSKIHGFMLTINHDLYLQLLNYSFLTIALLILTPLSVTPVCILTFKYIPNKV